VEKKISSRDPKITAPVRTVLKSGVPGSKGVMRKNQDVQKTGSDHTVFRYNRTAQDRKDDIKDAAEGMKKMVVEQGGD